MLPGFLDSSTPAIPFHFFHTLAKESLQNANLVKLLPCKKSFNDSPMLSGQIKKFLHCFDHLSSVYLSSLTFHHPSHKEPYVLFFPITHTSLCFTELIYIFLCTDVAHLFSHTSHHPFSFIRLTFPCFMYSHLSLYFLIFSWLVTF